MGSERRSRLRRSACVGFAVMAAMTVLIVPAAHACFVANQQLRILLGECDQGLVWVNVHVRRNSNEGELMRAHAEKRAEPPFTIDWTVVTGAAFLAPWNGDPPTEVPGLAPIQWTSPASNVRSGGFDLVTELDELSSRVKLPGFKRPSTFSIVDCGGTRACGAWRLRDARGALKLGSAFEREGDAFVAVEFEPPEE